MDLSVNHTLVFRCGDLDVDLLRFLFMPVVLIQSGQVDARGGIGAVLFDSLLERIPGQFIFPEIEPRNPQGIVDLGSYRRFLVVGPGQRVLRHQGRLPEITFLEIAVRQQ